MSKSILPSPPETCFSSSLVVDEDRTLQSSVISSNGPLASGKVISNFVEPLSEYVYHVPFLVVEPLTATIVPLELIEKLYPLKLLVWLVPSS